MLGLSSTTSRGYPIFDPLTEGDLKEYEYKNMITGAQPSSAMNLISDDIDALDGGKATIHTKTATEWEEDETTVIKAGEFGRESDTGKIKYGNGVDVWYALPYYVTGEGEAAREALDPTNVNGDAFSMANMTETETAKVMTGEERTKLAGIAEQANKYEHPANHLPSIITQDANNRFVTDAEKSTWNAKLSTETDPTVPAWAKAETKPSYTAAEVGAAEIPKEYTATLTAAAWTGTGPYTQTVTVTGVTPTGLVLISPAPASYAAYGECGARCTAQGTDSLTFTAESVPTVALTVNVGLLG